MKNISLLCVAAFSCLHAFAFRVEYGNNVSISQPVYEDLYIAGGTVTISAAIYGDLIIAGGTVRIMDSVKNDILVLGGELIFNGYAGDAIRCIGGTIRINNNVAGDVVIAGGNAIIDKNVTIGGLLAIGGNVTLNGSVTGNIKGSFGEIILNGDVKKDIDCRAGSITINSSIQGRSVLAARQIHIGPNASLNNDIRYWNEAGFLEIKNNQHKGRMEFDHSLQIHTGEWYYLGAVTLLGLLWYLGMAILMILIIEYFFSSTMNKTANTVYDRSIKSFGVGLLYFISVPLAILICLISIIGVPLALLLLICYLVLAFLGTVISSIVFANWINNRFKKNWSFMHLCFATLAIFILLKLVSLTPFVGWVVMTLMVCMSFGGILLSIDLKQKLKKNPLPKQL